MEPLENNESHIEPEAEPSRWSGMSARMASSVILAVLALLALKVGGWIFTLLVVLACPMMIREWNQLTEEDGPAWRIAGLFYAAIPCASMIWLRNVRFEGDDRAGAELVLYLLLVVWATDIAAYISGRAIGGARLAPIISPNKTWAGLGGGVAAAAIAGILCHSFSPYPVGVFAVLLLSMMLAVIAQAGDLFESWLKRRAGVKDSGTLIPGHGGLLDRIDGLIFTTPLFAWLVYMSGNII